MLSGPSFVNFQLISIACLPIGLVDSNWYVELFIFSAHNSFISFLYLQFFSQTLVGFFMLFMVPFLVCKFSNFSVIEWIYVFLFILCAYLRLYFLCRCPIFFPLRVLKFCFPHLSLILFSHIDNQLSHGHLLTSLSLPSEL